MLGQGETPVRDAIVVGAGMAGACLATTLARRGRSVSVVDISAEYPSDFRCEKLSLDQVELLRAIGAFDGFDAPHLLGAAPAGWTGRGIRYDDMVNTVRRHWPSSVGFHVGKALSVTTSETLQTVELSTGAVLRGRLIVLATGPGEKLRASLSIKRRVLSPNHSICFGFNLVPGRDQPLPFEHLIYKGEKPGDQIGYASFFQIDGIMRVNLFTYHEPQDPFVKQMRAHPLETLLGVMPGLRARLAGATVQGPAEMRLTELYECENVAQPGVVLIGDAFRSSCPATGTGVTRILVDVSQLSNAHLPQWLASPGMGAEKTARFYQDPIKLAFDAETVRRAFRGRQMARNTDLAILARRRAHKLKSWLTNGWSGISKVETRKTIKSSAEPVDQAFA